MLLVGYFKTSTFADHSYKHPSEVFDNKIPVATYSFPLNSGDPINSSARMQPMDQTSTEDTRSMIWRNKNTRSSTHSLCHTSYKRRGYINLCHVKEIVKGERNQPVCQHDLWCPVPPSCNIFRKMRCGFVWCGTISPA